jgi:6-phosphogluconolactonase
MAIAGMSKPMTPPSLSTLQKHHWHTHPDAHALAQGVSQDVIATLKSALAEQPQVSFGVAGGSTPQAVLPHLAQTPLDWARVSLLLSDDRWVEPASPLSNAGMLARSFAKGPGSQACRIDLVGALGALDADASAADARYQPLMPLDLLWLGVGADGHTASWFPGPDLARALDPKTPHSVIGVRPDPLPPEAPVVRLSLTLRAVLQARKIIIVATGQAKRVILENPQNYPVGALLQARAVTIHWCP